VNIFKVFEESLALDYIDDLQHVLTAGNELHRSKVTAMTL